MPELTSRGYPYPLPGDWVLPQTRDFIDLATAIDADVAKVASRSVPIPLSVDDDIDTLSPATYYASNVVIARALGLPEEKPASIIVTPVSSGTGVTYTLTTVESDGSTPSVYVRSRLNNGTLSEWGKVNMGTSGGDSSGPVRHDLLQQALLARKGGRIGTSGRGAVALRFDDAHVAFREKVLPLLHERGIPFTRVSTSESIGAAPIPVGELALMEAYSLDAGGEVWNHGTDHLDTSGDGAITADIVGALDALRAAMPRIPVDCFAPPGGSAMSYDGHMPSNTIVAWADTHAGRVIAGHHAIASGYLPDTYYKPLDGRLRDGQIHYSVDSYSLSSAKTLVNRARDWRVGVVLMWHPDNLGAEGRMSLADFEAFLDHLVSERDAGSVLVLTKSGLATADLRTDWRENILPPATGAPYAANVVFPQFRQGILGSTRELVATVTGTPGQSVTSAVGESERVHTIPESGTLALRHPVTIPLDITALAVTIDADTSGATLRPV